MNKIYTIIFAISVALTIGAVVAFAIFGLKLGVDFKGGSIMEISFSGERPLSADIRGLLKESLPEHEFSFNEVGNSGLVIRSGELPEENHQKILEIIKGKYTGQTVEENSFDSIGPVIGQELKNKSIKAIVIVLLAVIIYIAFVFRKMTVVLSPWAMGAAAITALFHDIIIPIGIFSILGHYLNVEISAVFVAAILTILGYSVSDTVVIFDRIRENVIKNKMREDFGEVVHISIMQTLTRSLNTTFTTLISLIAIYLFGGDSLKYFALALIIGIFLGAYSSIFVASPLLVWSSGWLNKKQKSGKKN